MVRVGASYAHAVVLGDSCMRSTPCKIIISPEISLSDSLCLPMCFSLSPSFGSSLGSLLASSLHNLLGTSNGTSVNIFLSSS